MIKYIQHPNLDKIKNTMDAIRVSDLYNQKLAFEFAQSLHNDLTESLWKNLWSPICIDEYDLKPSKQNSEKASVNLSSLRKELEDAKIDALLVSSNDEYLNEYTPLYSKQLFFITGFSGSYGFAVITKNSAALFVDGRYTEQAKSEVDSSLFSILPLDLMNIISWIKDSRNIKVNTPYTLGINAKSTSYQLTSYFIKNLSEYKCDVKLLNQNLIDKVWSKQPKRPLSPVSLYPEQYSGMLSNKKIEQVLSYIRELKLNSLFITSLDNIAWLLNMRGNDIEATPLFLSTLVLNASGDGILFVDPKKLSEDVVISLKSNKIDCIPEQDLDGYLTTLENQSIGINSDSPYFYFNQCKKNNSVKVLADNFISQLKCVKNKTEYTNSINTHIKDGVAITTLIMWLNQTLNSGESLDEFSVAKKLEIIKQDKINNYLGPSFGSIVASNANAAFPHYHASKDSSSTITKDSILLIDCGSQLLEGTTDITRTLSFDSNKISYDFKKCFTLVLQGFIDLSKLYFPMNKNISGKNLDAIARQFLWQNGFDFEHGTGHGVGHYLSVHEEPIRFNSSSNEPFKPGMIISIEPGFYLNSKFGIRIENLVLIIESIKHPGFLEFQPLTVVPIDIKNVLPQMLSLEQKEWLNNYQTKVYETLEKYFNEKDKLVLKSLTATL